MKNSDRPLISIIIPTRNRAESLEKCLLSIIALSCSDLEIVVVDGASDDNTPQLLERYDDHLTAWISEPDQGIYDALNKGCGMAHGDFFYFLGSDDLLQSSFGKVAQYLRKDHHTIYYGDVILAHSRKRYDGEFSRYKLTRKNINQQAIFYPRSVFDSHAFSLRYPIQADWELNMILWSSSLYHFKYINIPVAIFGTEGLSSTEQDDLFNQEYLMLIKKHFPLHVYIYRKILWNLLSVMKFFIPNTVLAKLNKIPIQF